MARILARILGAGVTALLLTVGTVPVPATSPAPAPCYTLKRVVCQEPYVGYEPRVETYTKCVTRKDGCGRPYQATVVCQREVQVPVKKVRVVVKYVKVDEQAAP